MPRKKTDRGARKIMELLKGRAYWRPGEEHPLDKLFEERDQLRERLLTELARLQVVAQQTEERLRAILDATKTCDDPAALFTPADQAAHQAIFQRFHNRKHYSHLQALFTNQRYKRLAGRLQAIGAALDLANGLLAEEETLSPEYLAAWQQSQDEADQQEDAQVGGPATELAAPLTREELRLQGIEEPLAAITGSAERSRQLLRDFEARLPDLRRQLATGQGWFEVFFVPKRHYKPEVVAYAKALARRRARDTPIPEEVEQAVHPQVRRLIEARVTEFPPELREQVYDIVEVGPYAKYRWHEEKRTYSISLGLEDDYPPFPFVPEGF